MIRFGGKSLRTGLAYSVVFSITYNMVYDISLAGSNHPVTGSKELLLAIGADVEPCGQPQSEGKYGTER